jgi:hypothetical protein
MRFVPKWTAVEAEQFWEGRTPWPDGVVKQGSAFYVLVNPSDKNSQKWHVFGGDWVITFPDGTRFPMRLRPFESSYTK